MNMINESVFEEKFVVKKFVDDLNYKKISNNLFNDENMLYQEGLREFILDTQGDKVFDIIKKEYRGDQHSFWKDFFSAVSNEVYYKHNVCIKMNKNILFKINGANYRFNIYQPFDDFSVNKNNYSVMSQLPVNRRKSVDNINIIPDIGVFVNGILICYMELKFNNTGQSAKDSGRKKIISDYSECIGEYIYPLIKNKDISIGEKNDIKSKKLKVFHSPIFLISLDNHEAYVYRNIRDLYNQALDDYKNGKSGISKETLKEGVKNFMLDSVFEKKDERFTTSKEKMDRFFENTFSKKSIQNEICILNTLKYNQNSKGDILDNSAQLFTPRPNQKFSIDLIAQKVKEYYEHEGDIYYFENKERKEMEDKGVPEIKINEILSNQRKFKNNKSVYSLLLQYSTGFGKTNIACASAILLKNMKNENNEYLFNKIFIISDRVDLREQMSIEIKGMNIGQSLYSTPKNKNELKSAIMSGHKRVIVVNIQKFKFLKKLLESENVSKLLKDERVAFIIDEIHRSNSGTMHNTMTDMFSDLTDDFLRFSENLKTNKKNLIIALTATPTEENLARFGEMDYIGGQPLWRPLDSYTMNSAIKDGFVLDPTKSLLFISQSYYFEEKEGVRLPNKKEIYSNVDRIKECSKIIVKTLIETTYNQIAKQAKAMLCCYSIEIANEYFDEIKKQLKEYLKIKNYSNKEIEEIQNMILMVYTDSQSSGLPAYKRCGMKNEKDVINKFKDGKNGLMIVVDKLQTGFNEPKLHTLILDKEVSGINCVQTLSRVNRVMKGKKDCLVVDFSYNNENAKNIRDAFKKYESVACSSIDPFSIQEKIEEDYKKIIKSEYYNLYFKDYEKNISRAMQKSEYINLKLNNENKENEIKNLHFAMSCFRKNVILIKEIILLREDIVSEDLMRFINEFMNIVYLLVKDKYDDSGFTDIVIEENGFIVNEEISTFDGGNNNVKEDKKNNKSTGLSSLDEIIERNKIEESKRENIEKYKKILHSFFEIIELKDEEKINGMFRKTLFVDEKISDEDYVRIYNLAKRDFRRKDEDCSKFIDMIDEVKEFIKNDYVYYLKNKK